MTIVNNYDNSNNENKIEKLMHNFILRIFEYFIKILLFSIFILRKVLKFIINILINVFTGSFTKYISQSIIHYTIIPIINILFPIVDIEKKFFDIINNNENDMYEPELTQEMWNEYIQYLQMKNTDTKKPTYDMFDQLIIQKMDQINFIITVTINRSDNDPRYISYLTFYSKLKDILGDAIDIKYRYTKNSLFVGIFGDEGPYRRFKYYDTI